MAELMILRGGGFESRVEPVSLNYHFSEKSYTKCTMVWCQYGGIIDSTGGLTVG